MPDKRENGVVHDKIIIGGGAAGLMAAYSACKIRANMNELADVLVLEKKDIPGKKLAATGNGKCNFTNLVQNIDCYRSDDPEKAYRIIEKFDYKETIELFKSIGILSTERKGYCYPIGEQARTFRDVLRERTISLGARIFTEKEIVDINKEEGVFRITCSDDSEYYSRKLIICTGGAAAPVFGTDGAVFNILKKMGINIKKLKPALCGLKTDYKYLKQIDGVRLKCEVSLYVNNEAKSIYSERGEIIFGKNGISGIPIMNMSRFAIDEMSEGSDCKVVLDFFPDMSLKELKEYLSGLIISCGDGAVGVALSALINEKILKAVFRELNFNYEGSSNNYDIRSIMSAMKKLAERLKHFDINITGDAGFENSQTTQGGVILKEINEMTMESYKYPGLYFAGEVLDVDGMCGGYNLQWAWTTGYIAGKS